MKLKLACASLLVLSACGPSREAMGALQSMQILQNDPSAPLSYQSISGSGNDLTLSGVEVRMGAGMMAMLMGGDDEDGEDEEGHEGHDAPPPPQVAADRGQPVTVAKAGSMTLRGLTLKDGKPVMRDLVLSGLAPTVPMDGVTLNVGSLSFEGMNEVTGLYIASAFTKDGAGEPPAFEQWGFSKAGIGALTMDIPIPQEEGAAGKVNIRLGEFSLSNLKDKTIGLAKLDGLKGDLDIPGMPPVVGTFDLGRMEVGGINTDRVASEFMQSFNERMNPGAPADYARDVQGLHQPAGWRHRPRVLGRRKGGFLGAEVLAERAQQRGQAQRGRRRGGHRFPAHHLQGDGGFLGRLAGRDGPDGHGDGRVRLERRRGVSGRRRLVRSGEGHHALGQLQSRRHGCVRHEGVAGRRRSAEGAASDC